MISKRLAIKQVGNVALLVSIGIFASACSSRIESLTLSFSSYAISPVVLTHFSIEQPLAPTQREIISGLADSEVPRTYGSNALSLPVDKDDDNKWVVSAQWVELPTDKAWQSSAEVNIDDLTYQFGGYELEVIFGPNGELVIGSDKLLGNNELNKPVFEVIDLAHNCGVRVPSADHAWRLETGYFPDVSDFMKEEKLNSKPRDLSFCPTPNE